MIFLIYFFAIGNWKSGTITGGTNTNKKKQKTQSSSMLLSIHCLKNLMLSLCLDEGPSLS